MTYNTNRRKVFIDMDGVIADFGAGRDEANLPSDIYKLQPEAYRYLPLYPGAREAVTRILNAGFDVWIATKIPSDNPGAATEKLLWINEHFPELRKSVIITPNKGTLGDKFDYLIDDRPHKAHCEEFEGKFYRFGPHNEYKDWNMVLRDLLRHTSKRLPEFEYNGYFIPYRVTDYGPNVVDTSVYWEDCDESVTIELDLLFDRVGLREIIEARNKHKAVAFALGDLKAAVRELERLSS